MKQDVLSHWGPVTPHGNKDILYLKTLIIAKNKPLRGQIKRGTKKKKKKTALFITSKGSLMSLDISKILTTYHNFQIVHLENIKILIHAWTTKVLLLPLSSLILQFPQVFCTQPPPLLIEKLLQIQNSQIPMTTAIPHVHILYQNLLKPKKGKSSGKAR